MGCCPVWCAGFSNLSASSCSLYFELWCLSQVGELYSWSEHQDIRRGSNRQCLRGFLGGMLRLMTHYLFSFSMQRLISFTRHLCGKLGNSKKLNAHMDRTLGNLSVLSKFLFFTLVPAMVCPSPRSSLQQGLTLTPEGWGVQQHRGMQENLFLDRFYAQHFWGTELLRCPNADMKLSIPGVFTKEWLEKNITCNSLNEFEVNIKLCCAVGIYFLFSLFPRALSSWVPELLFFQFL